MKYEASVKAWKRLDKGWRVGNGRGQEWREEGRGEVFQCDTSWYWNLKGFKVERGKGRGTIFLYAPSLVVQHNKQ